MKKSLIVIAAAMSMASCGTQQLATDTALGIAGEIKDVLTGPDSDYKNYLSACIREFKTALDAQEADRSAIKVGLASTHKEVAVGSLVLLATTSGKQVRPTCSVERKPGWLEGGSIWEILLRVYEINTNRTYARKKLESDEKIGLRQIASQENTQRQLYDLITTLSGDKLELQRDARGATPAE